MMLNFCRLFLLFWLLACSTSAFASNQVLTFGVIANRPKAEEQRRWQPLADYLTQSLQVKKVELRILNFAELDQQLPRYEFDFLLISASYYVRVHENNAMARAIATLVESHQGEPIPAFGGVIFCLRERNDINSLQDLRDKKIAIVNQQSFGGYQMQVYELTKAEIKLQTAQLLETDMPQDNVVNAVLKGQADVGFVRSDTLERMAKLHKLSLNQFKIINRQDLPSYPYLLSTRLYPQWPFVAMPSVDASLARKVSASLLLLEPDHPAMKAAGLDGFTMSADYGQVEELLRTLRLPPFDALPSFTLADVWQRYRYPLLVLCVTGGAIVFLLLLVLIKNRQLYSAQQAIAESENKYRTLFETANDGIFLQDAGGFLDCNQRGADLYGLSKAEVIGKSPAKLCPQYQPDGRLSSELVAEKIAAALRGEAPCFEWQPLHGDGTPFDVEITLNRVEYRGQPCLQAIVRDIGKRKQAEAELIKYRDHLEELVKARTAELEIARDAAEAANVAKSRFIATMSHELRTPLNAILGFSEFLAQDETMSAKQKETLAIINRSGQHLLSMINDVLDISKIEAGRLELNNQAFDLLKLLHEISDMIKVRAANKHLNFSLEISPNVPQYIKTDSGKLRQVLINLLGNAVKFTTEGQIILRTRVSPLSAMTMVMLEVEVIDSGMGIPKDRLDDLFQPFVQLARTDSGLEGTGLGLTISKSLIELMGGKISVSSVLGVGSTFKLELPVLIASSENLAIENYEHIVKSVAPNQPEWRLLVVDDNPDNRLLLVTILEEVGFAVREAENGQQTIEMFKQWQPHLIWMDMRMPVMDGYEATATIRQLPCGDAVKIIALTASAFIEQHTNIINAGCDAVLNKPFHALEIFAMLTKYLGVEFIYQDKFTSPVSSGNFELSPEMLGLLPQELQKQLHEAAQNLDIDETDAVIAQIRNLNPDIAGSLQKMAENYQFEQIIQLIDAANNQ